MSLRKSIFGLFLLLWASCGIGTDTVGTSATTQTLGNQGLQFLADLVQQIEDALESSSDCNSFNQALANLTGIRNCSIAGTQTVEILNSACTDSPEFLGEATLTVELEDCLEPGQTLGGTLQLELDWDGSLLTAQITSSNFSSNGAPYSIQNLTIQVEAGAAPECTGVLLIQGMICGVTPDCNFCPF